MTHPTDEQDEQQIRALIDAWCEASSAGDLIAQFNLMTRDVVFLTSGRAPMRRDEFAAYDGALNHCPEVGVIPSTLGPTEIRLSRLFLRRKYFPGVLQRFCQTATLCTWLSLRQRSSYANS